MFKNARYIHHMYPGPRHNGFSVQLMPAIDPGFVCVRACLCSKVDHFSRKKAREILEQRPLELILIKDLPEYLTKLERVCYGNFNLGLWDSLHPPTKQAHCNRWAWVWKYFL